MEENNDEAKVDDTPQNQPKEETKVEEVKDKPPVEDKKEERPEIKEEKPKIEEKKEEKPKEKKNYVLPFITSEKYDKNYKKFLIVWVIICLLIIANLVYMYSTTGDIMNKDVSLTGGTTISIYGDKMPNVNELSNFLSNKISEDVFVRTLTDITTGKQVAVIVETKADANLTRTVMEEFLGYSLTSDNSTTEVSGSNLSKSFYKQLIIALLLSFLFMGIVVFILFKAPIPSLAVIQCGLFDVLGALVIANIAGIRISTAGIAALLMLMGYSVDTDILLTTKVLKRRGENTLNSRIKGSFKTGIMMTLTSLIAVVCAYFIVTAPVLKQIFFILSAGLIMDLLGTWIGNAAILKWYCEKKGYN